MQAQPAVDRDLIDLGMVVALEREVAPFLKRCKILKREVKDGITYIRAMCFERSLVVVLCGAGQTRARRGTRALLETFNPIRLVSAGYAGSLNAELNIGDLVWGKTVIGEAGKSFQLSCLKEEGKEADRQSRSVPEYQVTTGTLLTVDEIINKTDDRERAAENYKANHVDMETLSVAEVAQEKNIPLFGLRVISDGFQTDMPPELSTIMQVSGLRQFVKVATAVCKRPRLLSELWKLKLNSDLASKNLAVELERFISMLPEK